jgi:hypothetical protein
MEIMRGGSTTARFPCTPLGSLGGNQGLWRDTRQTITRQPPACLACRLWTLIHSCPATLTCQDALSQMRKRARSPWAA